MTRTLKSPIFWALLFVSLAPLGVAWLALRVFAINFDSSTLVRDFPTMLAAAAVITLPLAAALGFFLSREPHDDAHRESDDMHTALASAQQQLLRAERIAAWRDIARRIAHEIKNPLQPIQMSIETLRKTRAQQHPDFDAIFEETTSTILEETQRLERIVSEFSRFARLPRPRPALMSLNDVVDSVTTLLRDERVAITHEKLPNLPEIKADREQLTQVVMNLVQNAKDAISGPGSIVITTRAIDAKHVELEVRDSGHGVPSEIAAQIFDPYLTTKAHGTGLGLAIAHRIVGDHQGTLELMTTAPESAVFRAVLPIAGPPFDATASTSEALGLIVPARER